MSQSPQTQILADAVCTDESIQGEVRSLREQSDRMLESATVSSESLDVYYCLRSRLFDRLRAALRFGGERKRVLQNLMEEMLDRDCALLEKLQDEMSQTAELLAVKR
jgi:hypothetical protein